MVEHVKEQDDLICVATVDANKELKGFFISYKLVIELVNMYPFIPMMDCTYKTNLYGLPLLVIVGITAFSSTFPVAFIMLSAETEEDYNWALKTLITVFSLLSNTTLVMTDREIALEKAVRTHFPQAVHSLCLWHINKNVESHMRKHIRDEEKEENFRKLWTTVCYSPDTACVDHNLNQLFEEYSSFPRFVAYLQELIASAGPKFMAVQLGPIFNLGQRATSRVESAHSVLKSYLKISVLNLAEIVQKMMLMWNHILSEHRIEKARNADIQLVVNEQLKHFIANDLSTSVSSNKPARTGSKWKLFLKIYTYNIIDPLLNYEPYF
ncbi:hypothetical protein GEMRC1_005440 [Eukaryota sp. GEM-RC1]